MTDDSGAAAGIADAGTTQDPAQAAGGSPAPGEDRDPEAMLADAVDAPDEDDATDDPAKALLQAQAEAKKWKDVTLKAEARANKAAATAKENAAAAKELADLKDRDKTELQRQTDRALKAEQRADQSDARYHRTLAAATYGVPPSLIEQISGSTEDECNASAEALAAAINEAADERAAAAVKAAGGQVMRGQRPVESMRAGAAPASSAALTPDGWLRGALTGR
jgi:hypothetical protein